jgi:hypothetical protein
MLLLTFNRSLPILASYRVARGGAWPNIRPILCQRLTGVVELILRDA